MPSLDSDVFYALVKEAVSSYHNGELDALLSLSSTCRDLRKTCLPILFSDVHWPHANKHDEESGLHFFPLNLWPFFRRFQLLWPEDWPDATPPRWGDRFYIGGDYHPRHIGKLVAAIPKMPSLTSFHLCCPFFPPSSILNTIIQCSSLREFSINETPLYISTIPKVPPTFQLERITLVPVGEAVRVGEGPYDARYSEPSYHFREYRKKYKNDVLARHAAPALLFQLSKPTWLRYVQMSADLCNPEALAGHEWPRLETLVLTGHTPRGLLVDIVDIVAKMPRLTELRLLFSKTTGDLGFRVLQEHHPTSKNNSPAVLAQLKHLALSNACNFDGVLSYATSLERLAVCAIIDMPRVPIALSRAEIDRMLEDMEVGHWTVESKLLRLRIMIEDKVNPALCHTIAQRCPRLEALEIEICGYHDGKSIHAWDEFASAFASLRYLRELRICIQFPEYDETDRSEPWRRARRECALHLASNIRTLRRVGFEYRKRTGTHRFEDSWLEFRIDRRVGDGPDGALELCELGPSWYPFPEVWFPVPVHITAEIGDIHAPWP